MAAPKLAKALAVPGGPELLDGVRLASGCTWAAVRDARGRVLWGAEPAGAPAALDLPIELEGAELGRLRGDARAAALLPLLRFMATQEAQRKALAGEVLDAYREITLLYNLSQKLTTSMRSLRLVEIATEEAHRLIAGTAGVALLTGSSGGEPASAAAVGPPAQVAELEALGRRILALGPQKAEIVNQLAADERFASLATDALRAILWAPLTSKERCLGLVLIGAAGKGEDYTAAHLSLLRTIASQTAPAFENAALYEDLERLVDARTRDLSTAKEEAEAANRAKNLFLASMSHELRTPLNALLGYAQILMREPGLTKKHFEGLDVIQRSGEHLLMLINDLLDLSRIEAGRVELELGPFDLRSLLDDIQAMFRVRAEQRGLDFRCRLDPALPAWVEGDPKRLRQVLINLLSNAIKFTDAGHVRLDVRGEGASRVAFRVEDTGVGVAPEHLEEIFQSFRQLARSRHVAEGTGLGLAISKQLTALLGGTLDVESEVGRGSTFVLALELPPVAGRPPAPPRRTIVGFRGEPVRVLVVDDNAASRGVLRGLLAPLGFEVLEARDGREALAKVAEAAPRLVLMDLVMPVLSGFEAIAALRAEPRHEGLCIIALSASVAEPERERSLACGADDFVPKPVRGEQLLEAVRGHLDLTWIYAEPGAERSDAPPRGADRPGDAPRVVPPSGQVVRVLSALARQGDFSGLCEQLAALRAQGIPEHEAFLARAERLTREFKLRELGQLLGSFPGGEA